ncbi:Phosphatidylglycerol--prolipoprotein diacylglyceryl transferase [subsurface metagenome]
MIDITMSPIAFTIGSFSVRWYGIMVALAVLVVVLWVFWEIRRGAKVSYDTLFTAALVGIPAGIIFSRMLHVIDLWDYYGANPGQIIGFSGLTIYGAILGAVLAIWIYSKLSRFRFGYVMDLVAPGVLLAQAVGRVGCTINGCCYGAEAPSWLPWSVVYTHPQSYGHNASLGLPEGIGLHPTQVYEIAFLLIAFGVLFPLRKRFQPDGSLFLIYLSAYSAWRVGVGFLRDGTSFLFGLHQAQVIGIIVLIIAITILIWRTRWVKKPSSA